MQVSIQKLIPQGWGLGHADEKTVMVQCGLPGDVVEAKPFHTGKRVVYATIGEVLTPSPLRREANCVAYGRCGGCDWLALDYEHQLKAKEEFIRDWFKRLITPQTVVHAIQPSPSVLHYRNKTTLPARNTKNGLQLGMYAPNTHRIIPHDDCLLHNAEFSTLKSTWEELSTRIKLPAWDGRNGIVRHVAFRSAEKGLVTAVVTKGSKLPFSKGICRQLRDAVPGLTGIVQNINNEDGNRVFGDKDRVLWGEPWLYENLNDRKYRVHYRAFFQINPPSVVNMLNFLAERVIGSSLADVYCGTGAIGIYLQANKTWFLESDITALGDARHNAALNGVTNAEFIHGPAEQTLPALAVSPDTIVVDPPRKGLDAAILPALTRARRLLYISCHPATQARDVETLCQMGYRLTEVKPFDLFPQTWHVENVVVLDK